MGTFSYKEVQSTAGQVLHWQSLSPGTLAHCFPEQGAPFSAPFRPLEGVILAVTHGSTGLRFLCEFSFPSFIILPLWISLEGYLKPAMCPSLHRIPSQCTLLA